MLLGIASWKIPGLCGISKLESQFQDSTVCKVSVSLTMDQRSQESKINRRYQALDFRWRDFTDFDEMLDAKIASALKKILTSVHFRKRVSVEEQRGQKDDRFLRGRQIAYMIYQHFRATGGSLFRIFSCSSHIANTI